VGRYFSCPLHMQEHNEDCHSYKRSVLGVRYRPEAADLHKAIILLRARQATHIKLSRAPVCRRTVENQTAPSAKRTNAEVMAPLPEASATHGAAFPRAPVLRMGSRPLSVGGERGGRGGRGDGATRGLPQGRPTHARLASVARIPLPNKIYVPNSGNAHYRISPVGDVHNLHDHHRPYAAVADRNGGGTAPLGVPLTHTHTTHNRKAVTAGASPP
jgi:hypothetical protein